MVAQRRPVLALALGAGAALALVRTVAPAFAGAQPGARGRVLSVARAASQEDIAAAEKSVQLLSWAADKLVSEGSPQAAGMQAKAAEAVQTLAALKDGGSAPAATAYSPPAASTPVAPAPVMPTAPSSAVSPAAVQKAKDDAALHTWAAKTLAEKGSPQAAAMQAKASQMVQTYEALKQQLETGAAPVAVPAAAAPAAPVAVAAAPVVTGSAVSKEAVAKAKDAADLAVWAAKTLAAKGAPAAASMQAKADELVQQYTALKQQLEGGAAPGVPAYSPPAAPAPAAVAPVAPVAAAPAASPEAVKKAKEEADLAVWAAKTLAAKGAPEAAMLKARAEEKMQAYEALKSQMALR